LPHLRCLECPIILAAVWIAAWVAIRPAYCAIAAVITGGPVRFAAGIGRWVAIRPAGCPVTPVFAGGPVRFTAGIRAWVTIQPAVPGTGIASVDTYSQVTGRLAAKTIRLGVALRPAGGAVTPVVTNGSIWVATAAGGVAVRPASCAITPVIADRSVSVATGIGRRVAIRPAVSGKRITTVGAYFPVTGSCAARAILARYTLGICVGISIGIGIGI
jgi:hypothetical protein